MENKIISSSTQLRKLAWKSTMKFGKHSLLSVQQVFSIDRTYLLWVYYNCSNISFVDEVMQALRLTEEWQIAKPGVDPEMLDRKNASDLGTMTMASLKKMRNRAEKKLDAVDTDTLLPKSFVPKHETIKTKIANLQLNRNVSSPNLQFVPRPNTFNPVFLKKTIGILNDRISEKYEAFNNGNRPVVELIPDLSTGHHVLETLKIMVEIKAGSAKHHLFNGALYGAGVRLLSPTRGCFLPAALSTDLFEISTADKSKETLWKWTGVEPSDSHVKVMMQWFSEHHTVKVKPEDVPIYLFDSSGRELMTFKNKKEATDYFKIKRETLNYHIRKGTMIRGMYYVHTNRYKIFI